MALGGTLGVQTYMKRSELLFSMLLVPLDAVMIFAAFLLSYYARVESGALPVAYVFPLNQYVAIVAAITAVWLVIFALSGLYTLRSTRRGLSEFYRILAATSIGTLVVVATIFFLRINFFSRLVIIIAFITALVLVTMARIVMRLVQRSFFRYGIGVRRALIVGTGRTATILANELTKVDRGYSIIGYIKESEAQKTSLKPILGNLNDAAALVKKHNPDELLDADPKLNDAAKQDLINIAEDAGIDFRFTSTLAELVTSRVEAVAVAGIPVMTVQRTALEGWGRVMKRLLDLTASLLALPLVIIIYLLLAIAIKMDSPGPAIFKQTRVGKGGREFESYKFRSMVKDAETRLADLRARNEATGPVFKMKDDPRVTRVGRFLRRTSLDELPQIFNVIRGEMSLVGPRPPLPTEVAQYDRLQRRRLTIKPGITGPWQVSGRSDISFEEWVRLDVYYIQNWSLLLDITILLKTVYVVLRRKGAY